MKAQRESSGFSAPAEARPRATTAMRVSQMRAAIPSVLRDAWALAALEKAGIVAAADVAAIRAEAPEWVADAVVARGLASAERVATALAQAARVPLANLNRVATDVSQFLPEGPARQHAALPLSATNRTIVVATANPFDHDAERAIGFATSRTVEFVYALPSVLAPRIEEAYRPERSIERLVAGLGNEATLEAVDDKLAQQVSAGMEAPAAKLVDATIADAVREGASDLHLEPTAQGLVIRYRIDGVLREVMRVPRSASNAVVRRIKVTAGLDVSDPLRPHDGRAVARVDGKAWDLRVSSIPIARLGEKVVIRLLDPDSQTLKLDNMGLEADDRRALDNLLGNREGIVLVTGPTGSGKTSTLYAALDAIRTPGINVVTVEDPVEYRIPGVNQIEVNEKQGFGFAGALRSVLRQDPDMVLLGEIRDQETAQTAWQAALSGHFVMSTLHTSDAASAVVRLVDLGIQPFRIAAALKGVVAQRLVRRLCPHCAREADQTSLPAAARPPAGTAVKIRARAGCPKCSFTGYKGRVAIEEILVVDTAMAKLIANGARADQMIEVGRRNGMRTLWEAGLRRVWSGETGYEEIVRVVGEPATSATQPPSAYVEHAAAAAMAASDGVVIRTSGERAPLILVADDDPLARTVASTALSPTGYQVAEAEDGMQALLELQRLQPDLIVLDMVMPNMDGFMVLGAIRQRLSARAIPVIVVTSRDDAETERRCLELGAEDFIVKPVAPAMLLERVQAVLRRTAAR